MLTNACREESKQSINSDNNKKGEKKSRGLKCGNYIHVNICHKSVLMVNNVEQFSQ